MVKRVIRFVVNIEPVHVMIVVAIVVISVWTAYLSIEVHRSMNIPDSVRKMGNDPANFLTRDGAIVPLDYISDVRETTDGGLLIKTGESWTRINPNEKSEFYAKLNSVAVKPHKR